MSQEPTTDLTGLMIGEYEIIARIGVGGMGVVYEGKQPLIGKRVAVKVLLPSLSDEQGLVDRFLAEARAVNEIRHRGIVDIFSFGQLPDGKHYFVMEFLQGEAFDRIVKRRAPLSIGEALQWTDEVLDALEAAHQAGIIHRDIKPSNLFLVDTGRGRPYVKLLDFGIAKLGAVPGESTPQTQASMVIGTPDYMSPEQARGQAISPATDLYALGAVLFELVTGRRVFRGENQLRTMWMHADDPPPVPSTLNALIPPQLDELILWALEKDPAARPTSAEEMRQHVVAIRAALPAELHAPTPAPLSLSRLRPSGQTPAPIAGAERATPSPSGRHLLRPTPAPVSGGRGAPTRLARHPAAGRPSAPGPSSQRETAAELGPVADPQPQALQKSRLLLVAGLGALLLLGLGVGGYYAVSTPDRASELPLPIEPMKVEPVKVEPVNPEPSPVVAGPVETPVEPVKAPDEPKRAELKKAISPAALEARYAKLEARLAQREAESGDRDAVLRRFLAQARASIDAARTEQLRRDAGKLLDEIAAQLNR